MMAARSRPQDLNVYDLANGRPLAALILDHNFPPARFVPEQEQLLVLRASHFFYRLNLEKLDTRVDQNK